jgi:hypothetical protein
MTGLASINGNTCTQARMQISAWGNWWLDVDMVDPVLLAGPVSIAFADIAAQGTIASGGVANGKAAYRIGGGALGWGKQLKAKGYANDAGVKLATVLGDAAQECGETLADIPATRLGTNYARGGVPERSSNSGSALLNALAPRNWYVDFAGVTHIGQRPTTIYTGAGARSRVDPQGAIIELATETIGALVPGVVVDGSQPASDIEYMLDATRLTVRVYAGRASSPASRFNEALAKIVESLFPDMRWRGTYEFRVIDQNGERFDLQPVRVATGMPDLSNVPVRGPAGVKAIVQPGELVCVSFLDADPSRAYISAHDAPDGPGWMPLFCLLGEEPQLGVARLTDGVIAGGFAGAITFASTRIKAGL